MNKWQGHLFHPQLRSYRAAPNLFLLFCRLRSSILYLTPLFQFFSCTFLSFFPRFFACRSTEHNPKHRENGMKRQQSASLAQQQRRRLRLKYRGPTCNDKNELMKTDHILSQTTRPHYNGFLCYVLTHGSLTQEVVALQVQGTVGLMQ